MTPSHVDVVGYETLARLVVKFVLIIGDGNGEGTFFGIVVGGEICRFFVRFETFGFLGGDGNDG